MDFEPPNFGSKKQSVPDEYAHDPDLWYAIQASMNDDPQPAAQDNQENNGVRDHPMITDQDQERTGSTGENIASLNDAFETPKRKAEQGIKTFDFLGQLSTASNN